MNELFLVIIDTGTATTHRVVVRARSHEEAESQALLAAGIDYNDVRRVTASPTAYDPFASIRQLAESSESE